MAIDKLLTVKEVSDLLRLSVKTVHRMIADGRIRASKMGTGKRSEWRIGETALDEFLRDAENRPSENPRLERAELEAARLHVARLEKELEKAKKGKK